MNQLPKFIVDRIRSNPMVKQSHPRYWVVLEDVNIMATVQAIRDYDGMALDFTHPKFDSNGKTTEGLCLFARADKKMSVMRIASIPTGELLDSSFSPKNYSWESPDSIVDDFNKGRYRY